MNPWCPTGAGQRSQRVHRPGRLTVPGTLRDSLVLLSVVLEQQTKLQPTEGMSDTGACTDTILRLADIGGTRFWRVDGKAGYGTLDGLAAQRVNVALAIQHWEDLLRLAGSLKLGAAQAAGLIRTLQAKDRPTKLVRALDELGRPIRRPACPARSPEHRRFSRVGRVPHPASACRSPCPSTRLDDGCSEGATTVRGQKGVAHGHCAEKTAGRALLRHAQEKRKRSRGLMVELSGIEPLTS